MANIGRFFAQGWVAIGIALCLPLPAQAQDVAEPQAAPAPIDLLQSMRGFWVGRLEYLDYSANEWFGIPATFHIIPGSDGVSFVRLSEFDDGPKVGMVLITSVSMLAEHGTTEYATSFRKGRVPELSISTLRVGSYTDATHWVLISDAEGQDDNRPARLRVTTTRDGEHIVALKQVDFTDDSKDEWLDRNRTTMQYNGVWPPPKRSSPTPPIAPDAGRD